MVDCHYSDRLAHFGRPHKLAPSQHRHSCSGLHRRTHSTLCRPLFALLTCPVVANNGIAISMDGRGAWRDNVFIERLWRSVKYEEVYLRAYDGVSEARASIGRYLNFYNGRRPHSSLDGMAPDKAYFTPLPLRLAA
jgi:transposase InsO family protein